MQSDDIIKNDTKLYKSWVYFKNNTARIGIHITREASCYIQGRSFILISGFFFLFEHFSVFLLVTLISVFRIPMNKTLPDKKIVKALAICERFSLF